MQGLASFLGWATAGMLLAGAVGAQELEALEAPDIDGAGADVGGGRWSANVRGTMIYTDNFFYEQDATQSASGWLLRPQLGYLTETARTRVELNSGAEYGSFNIPGSADDYLDGHADLEGGVQLSSNNRLQVTLGGKRGHDPFGLDRTESASPTTTDLDEWNEIRTGIRHRFGTAGAIMNTEFGADTRRRTYVSNRSATQFLDYDATTVDAALFYNVSAKTAALVDIASTDYQFDYRFSGADNRSGRLLRSRVGVRWMATGKTSGDVRVGFRSRDFDSGDKSEGLDWEAGVQWRPVWPALVRLSTGRTEMPSYLSGVRSIDVQYVSAEWEQPWTTRLRSRLGIRAIEADFLGTTRQDDTTNSHLEVEYRLTRRAAAVANLAVGSRDSSAAARDFDRFSSFVGVQVGF